MISSIPLYSREVPRIFSDGTPISLSICIPTYNRSEALCELIRQVLSCPAQDIEVVVLDNGSTDCTLEKLAEIKDSRLTVYSNEINRGVLFNVINVLLLGRGYHTVLLLDKDSLDPLSIEKFKQFLSEEDPACGYSRYHLAVDSEPDIAAAGIPALQLVGYAGHHPTGYFFRTALLHQLEIEQRFCTYSFVGHFPFDFILAECSLLGAAAIYNAPAFAPEDLTSAAKNKSFGTNAGKEDAFFSPKGRLKMAINFTRHISGLSVPATIKRQFVLNFFAQGMFAATLGYRKLMRTDDICEHYHIATRKVGLLELVYTALCFYRSFYLEFPGGVICPEVQLSHIHVVRDCARRLLIGSVRRLVRRFS